MKSLVSFALKTKLFKKQTAGDQSDQLKRVEDLVGLLEVGAEVEVDNGRAEEEVNQVEPLPHFKTITRKRKRERERDR